MICNLDRSKNPIGMCEITLTACMQSFQGTKLYFNYLAVPVGIAMVQCEVKQPSFPQLEDEARRSGLDLACL